MMTNDTRPDAIDRAAGLAVGGQIFDLRAARPEFLEGGEACRVSVLEPQDDLGLSRELRLAVARRITRGADNPTLLAEYPQPTDPKLLALAEGNMPQDPLLSSIAVHTDMIAANPAAASNSHLTQLLDAGLSVPQIIALSELLAFVCFQMRVVHGLSLLEQAP